MLSLVEAQKQTDAYIEMYGDHASAAKVIAMKAGVAHRHALDALEPNDERRETTESLIALEPSDLYSLVISEAEAVEIQSSISL